MADEELTYAQKEQLREVLGYGSVGSDGSHNIHAFLHNVATAKDTTKLGNLKDEEIGNLENPVRALKFLALFSDRIMRKQGLKDFFIDRSEIGTSTSLSRAGFLTKLAVVQRRELADVTPKERKQNKSWFKPKEKKEEDVTNQ